MSFSNVKMPYIPMPGAKHPVAKKKARTIVTPAARPVNDDAVTNSGLTAHVVPPIKAAFQQENPIATAPVKKKKVNIMPDRYSSNKGKF